MDDFYKQNREVLTVLAQHFDVFDCKGRVPRITNVEFKVRIRPGAVIPKTNGAKLDPERLECVQKWMQACLEKNYAEKGEVVCVFHPVVVDKKGPEKFRTCMNFQPLDEVLEDEPELE